MDSSTRVILKVETPEYKKVVIETSDGQSYFSDLKALSSVYCYPKTKPDWDKVSADSYGPGGRANSPICGHPRFLHTKVI